MTQLSRLQETLKCSPFDAVIISSELNIRYLCGFAYTDGYLLISAEKAFLLTDFRYIEAARSKVKDLEIIMPQNGMKNALSDIIRDNKFIEIGIEEEELSYKNFGDLRKALPENCSLLAGASAILLAQRAQKLDCELKKMEEAQRITDLAFSHILPMLNTNITEIDVALELEFFMRKHGAEGVAFETIAVSGSASSLPHGVPSDEKLKNGFLTMDLGAKLDGYCSDMTRTVVIGKASEEMKKIYNTVLSAQKAALDGIHEGISCRDADALARNIIENNGYGKAFGHSLGHGVGMFIHENPRLSPSSPAESKLCRGNVVTVEPGIYLEGKFGCRIEDMIAINREGKLINFTKSPKELIEI